MARNRIRWTLSGQSSASDLLELPTIRSLSPEDVGVAYQPIVDVTTGATFAYEALVRCRRPEFSSPLVLLDQASREGAHGRLGRMIRDVAFRKEDVALFINLHPDELSSRWLVRPDDPIGFHPNTVYLEITETAAFTHFELCLSVLKELCRRTGAKLVVDDFGAGHSNLQRVVDLEPSVVKLDLCLTRDVHELRRKQAVVRHMVNLCEELDAKVVAEGVERTDELSCLIDLGVHFAQGYLLARPAMPAPLPTWPPTVALRAGARIRPARFGTETVRGPTTIPRPRVG